MGEFLTTKEEQDLLKELSYRLSSGGPGCAVTLVNNHFCMRWKKEEKMVDVKMVVISCSTLTDLRKKDGFYDRLEEVRRKFNGKKMEFNEFEDQYYYIETGEYPK